MKKLIIAAAIALSTTAILTPSAHACSMEPIDVRTPAEIKAGMENGKFLFTGIALGTVETKYTYKTTFLVKDVKKGDLRLWIGLVTITHFQPNGPCNTVWFTPGKTYTVSASETPEIKLFTDSRRVIAH